MGEEGLSLRALEHIVEAGIELLEVSAPGFTSKLFRRVGRNALDMNVVDFRSTKARDIESYQEALAWLAAQLAAPRRKRRR